MGTGSGIVITFNFTGSTNTCYYCLHLDMDIMSIIRSSFISKWFCSWPQQSSRPVPPATFLKAAQLFDILLALSISQHIFQLLVLEQRVRTVTGTMILAPNSTQTVSTGKNSRSPLTKLILAENLFTASNFFDNCECQSWIRFCISTGFVEVKANATHETARRYHGRIQAESISTADLIFRRLLPLLPTNLDGSNPVGCSSNIRLYRYTVGQSFGKHIDESKNDEGGLGVSKLTVLIYLSGDENSETRQRHPLMGAEYLVGGETKFYSERIISNKRKIKHTVEEELCSVKPAAGKLLVHAHGDRCLTHEGAPVLQGIKYVLRTDVIYRWPAIPFCDVK